MKVIYTHLESEQGEINDNSELLDIVQELEDNFGGIKIYEYFNDNITAYRLGEGLVKIFRTFEKDNEVNAEIIEFYYSKDLLDFFLKELGYFEDEISELPESCKDIVKDLRVEK